MSEKATATAAPERTSHRGHGTRENGGPLSRLVSETPFFGLQQTLGNQAMLQLLESGVIRAKLRVSQPGDPDETEADRAAEKVVSAFRAPAIHRKCACDGGTPCAKCAAEREEETIHRSVATPLLRSVRPAIQRAPADPTSTADPVPAAPEKQPPGAKTSGTLVVEDNAEKVEPYQMRKRQFIALLRTEACAAADAALASVKHTTKGCPYVAKWLSFYEKQSSEHIERAIRKYAPEAAKARSAREAIRILVMRVERAAITWARTGKVEGLPEDLAKELPGQGGFLGAVRSFASTSVGGAVLGFIGGTKKQESTGGGEVQRKARTSEATPAHDAAAVRAQLGTGHTLDSRVQSQMSSAFGHDFSGVRVHDDASASKLSSDLQARAFTVGSDVAFASGEYRPGTLIGDALIAHELAHVVQQSGGSPASTPQRKSESDDSALEQDADRAAVGALFSSWPGIRRGKGGSGRSAVSALRSGLALQRCKEASTTSSSWSVDDLKANFNTCDGTTSAHTAVNSVTVQVGHSVIGTGGSTSGSTITLDANKDKCDATQILVLELSNYSHDGDFKQIGIDAQAGDVSRDAYIRRNEALEYDGVTKALATYDFCKDKWVCRHSFYEGYRSPSFNEYFPKIPSIHTEHYGRFWDANFKAAYEAKHPPAPPPPHPSHGSLIQRSPAGPTTSTDASPAAPEKQPPGAKTAGTLVVEDNATKVEPYQMRKSQFIALLRTEACAAADAALASVKHTTKGCPYVAKWLSFYEKQSSEHIERAIRKYAPEAAKARSAHEATRILVMRIERAAITWAKTGKVEGLPEDLAKELPGQGGFLGAIRSFASTSVGGAILGFIGGTKKHEEAPEGEIHRKANNEEAAPAHDAAAVRAQLGTGHSLDSRVRSQMSSAFGHDFSGVRVHTDSFAATLSSDLQARAFTVGSDVAFASGEYRPGTLIGDALIAHELAHVVQQRASTQSPSLMHKGVEATEPENQQLENDADLSAVSAVTHIWTPARRDSSNIHHKSIPLLSSRLRLQRCGGAASEIKKAEPTATTAAEIIRAAHDESKAIDLRAKDVVESIIHTYYPGEAEKVDSVEYNDEKAKGGLQTEEVFSSDRDRSKIKGKIFVGSEFVKGKGGVGGVNERDFSRRVLQVGHELEHISQFRDPNLTPVRNKDERRRRKDEREFLAFYHEAVGIEKPGTGTMQHGSRANLIDAALGYYYCLTDDKKSGYQAQFTELINRRAKEIELSKWGADHFGPAPTDCKRASD